jgi:MFS family permease
VICASICNVPIGAYYFFSNINSYLAAYLRQYDPNVTAKDTLLIMPVYIVLQSLGSILSIKLSARYGYVMVSNVSYAIFALSSLAMVICTNYWIFVFLYGFLNGLVIGTGYMPALCIAWTYYPDKKSIITGISLFTAGFSASILSPMSTAIVNPENIKDYENDPRVYNRVPTLFFWLFVLYGGLNLVGILLQPPPFESSQVKELRQLSEIEKLAEEDKLQQKSIKQGSQDKPLESALMEEHHTSHPLQQNDNLRHELIEELRKENKGFISAEESYAMANMKDEDLANLVGPRKSVQHLIEDRKQSIRQSIRQDFRHGHDVRQSIRMRQQAPAKPTHLADLENLVNDILKKPAENVVSVEDDKHFKRSVVQLVGECPSLKFGLMSWSFFCLSVMAYSCSIYNYFMNSVWKQFYVTKIEVSDSQMALILSYGAFANSIVRVMSGFALQKYDFKYIFLMLVCSTAFCCFTINFTLVNYIIGALYSMTVFGGIGVQVTIFPTVCTKVFGPIVGPKVFPFVFSFFSMANLTQYFMLKLTDDWGFMFFTYGVIACIGIGFGIIFNSSPDWRDASYLHMKETAREEEGKELVPVKTN